MKTYRPLMTISAALLAALFWGLPATADGGSSDGYRAPIGPPAPRTLSEDEKKEREKAKKLAAQVKARSEYLGRPWALELLPHDLNRFVYDAAEASGGVANYNYLYGDYRADVADREPGWAEKRKVLRKGPLEAELGDDANPFLTLQNTEPSGPVSSNRLAAQVSKRSAGSLRLNNYEAARNYGGRDNAYYRYGNNGAPIPGLDGEAGFGPFDRCRNNDKFERDRGFC